MKSRVLLFSLGAAQILPSFGAYVWPAKTDALEDVIFNDSGYNAAGVGNHIIKCGDPGRGDISTGAQVAAAWLRTAYHDMITYVGAEKAGGLDASVLFETDRMENIGIGFNNTFLDIQPGYSSRVGMADVITAAAYFALRKCGGPAIDVRAGRVDAQSGGTFGAPDPTETFHVHRMKFERANRNQTQMIQMIACGHSIGGVHGNDFPAVTLASDPAFIAHFDSTFNVYDNHVALDFISGNTSNPLASGPRMSQSDFRIFTSDGNKTITSMSTPEGFAETCRRTITQMVETVPEGVELTEPITPSPLRPTNLKLTVNRKGSVNIQGEIRLHTDGVFNAQLLDVQLTFTDRNGKALPKSIKAPYINRGFGVDFQFDYFKINVDLPTGISSMNVMVGDKLYDNAGHGFQIADQVVFQQADSCYVPSTKTVTVYAAVSKSISTAEVKLEVYDLRPRLMSIIPGLYKDSVNMVKVTDPAYSINGYDLYSGTYAYTTEAGGEFSVAAYAAGKRYADDFKKTSLYNGSACAAGN
ncbi:hypothetical protein APHAL10511_003592 [Amanita phalloides]|nr:hypothetical protein APHAL10511_003592 [Amanita phalloides]